MTQTICGVDVSAATLDAAIEPGGPAARVANTPDGCAELAAFCQTHKVDLVVMEATGGYERQPLALLWAEGVPCTLANPRHVRRFAEAMGHLEKTDRIDARVIARFAAARRLTPQPPASEAQERLTALVTRRRQLVALRVAQANQRRLVSEPAVQASIDELLVVIRRQTGELEAQIAALIQGDPLWRKVSEVCGALKGVAGTTVACLLAEMPEIGTLSGKAASKLAGLAPLARDSGQSSGRRPVRGGRAGLRGILYVVAGLVRRYEADFAEFDRRLRAAGKPLKVIRVALAHKLLVRLNAKARQIRAEMAAAA